MYFQDDYQQTKAKKKNKEVITKFEYLELPIRKGGLEWNKQITQTSRKYRGKIK